MNNYENLNPVDLLNQYLANLKVLNNNLYNLHFNVVGPFFFTLHSKLNEYYDEVADMYDSIAERIKMIGGYPITSLTEYERVSTIKSMRSQNFNEQQVLSILENDFTFMISLGNDLASYFSSINDNITSGIISDNLKFFEKQLWMIKASRTKDNSK